MTNKCIKCGVRQEYQHNYEHISLFFTVDGYCSVCNHKYRDRPRPKPIFAFTTKDINYDHYSKSGGYRLSNFKASIEKYGGGSILSNRKRRMIMESKKRRMDEYI